MFYGSSIDVCWCFFLWPSFPGLWKTSLFASVLHSQRIPVFWSKQGCALRAQRCFLSMLSLATAILTLVENVGKLLDEEWWKRKVSVNKKKRVMKKIAKKTRQLWKRPADLQKRKKLPKKWNYKEVKLPQNCHCFFVLFFT